MEAAYHRPVCPINAVQVAADQLNEILQKLLYEFPLKDIAVTMPPWVTMLEPGHWLQSAVYKALLDFAGSVHKMGDMTRGKPQLDCSYITGVSLTGMDLATGEARIRLGIDPSIFYRILGEQTGLAITDEASLLPRIKELAKAKKAYDKIKGALEQVEATGYGIVMPGIEELTLEEPEIVRQGGQYGVRLSASAPSLHLMRATIHTELSPTVGSEEQGEELIKSLLKDFEGDPGKLWSTNIFGKSLNELVNEGLQAKLLHMPMEARSRLQQTLEKIIKVSDLSTYEAVYNGVAKVMNEQNVENVDYYVSYDARIKAGIDFEKVDVDVDHDQKVITVKLPEIEIQDVNVDIASLDYIFINNAANTATVSEEAYKKCKEDAIEESKTKNAIYDLAEQNLQNIIEALISPFVEQLDSEYQLQID